MCLYRDASVLSPSGTVCISLSIFLSFLVLKKNPLSLSRCLARIRQQEGTWNATQERNKFPLIYSKYRHRRVLKSFAWLLPYSFLTLFSHHAAHPPYLPVCCIAFFGWSRQDICAGSWKKRVCIFTVTRATPPIAALREKERSKSPLFRTEEKLGKSSYMHTSRPAELSVCFFKKKKFFFPPWQYITQCECNSEVCTVTQDVMTAKMYGGLRDL